jgi:hypothetical protein
MYTKAESDSLKNKVMADYRVLLLSEPKVPLAEKLSTGKKIALYIMIYHFCKRVGGTCIPKQRAID